MSDNPKDDKTQDPQTDPKDDKSGDGTDPEKSYWDKMTTLLDQRISAGVDKKIAELRGNSTSRTGRTTVPKVLADFFFPEPKVRD